MGHLNMVLLPAHDSMKIVISLSVYSVVGILL
jgi:hypothetical protein